MRAESGLAGPRSDQGLTQPAFSFVKLIQTLIQKTGADSFMERVFFLGNGKYFFIEIYPT